MYNFCFDNFSMSEIFTLSANADNRFFSISFAFDDFVSGQKKILMPEGVSGNSQKNSQFHKLLMNEEFGLNATFLDCNLWMIMSLALNWLFLAKNAV